MANIKDGATGTVLTAPSPQSSGTSLTLNSGEGARFPAPPFWAVAHPNNGIPVVSVSEKILVTAVAGDTFTISRSPYGIYTAKNIDVGWRVSNAIFQDDFNNASIINNEVPAGTINGVNTTFTLASSVHTTGTLIVYKNGVRMRGGGNDFTETATGFTMVTAPATGTVLLVDYIVTGAINNVGTNSFIWDETPAGTVNGSTTLFTAARAYIPGSLAVYINGLKQKRVTHFVETNPALGTFTMGDAPLTGDDIMIDYQFNLNPSSNSDTVDGIHANSTPTANMLAPLDANGKTPLITLPSKIIGSAKTNTQVTGITTTETAIISAIVTITPEMVASGLKLKIKGGGPQLYSTVGGDRLHVGIFDGTTTLNQIYQGAGTSASGWTPYIETPPNLTMPAAGTYTFSLRVARDIGSGSTTAYADATSPIWIEVRLE